MGCNWGRGAGTSSVYHIGDKIQDFEGLWWLHGIRLYHYAVWCAVWNDIIPGNGMDPIAQYLITQVGILPLIDSQ